MLETDCDKKIGGHNKTVEIDESMFGKRRVCSCFKIIFETSL